MSFVEFIEAITRACDMVYEGNRPLEEKLFDMMPTLLSVCSRNVQTHVKVATKEQIEAFRLKY